MSPGTVFPSGSWKSSGVFQLIIVNFTVRMKFRRALQQRVNSDFSGWSSEDAQVTSGSPLTGASRDQRALEEDLLTGVLAAQVGASLLLHGSGNAAP